MLLEGASLVCTRSTREPYTTTTYASPTSTLMPASAYAEMGMIFQGGARCSTRRPWWRTVKLPLDLFTEQSEEEKMERGVNFCLRRVNLDNAHRLYPSELSGGRSNAWP